MKKLFLLFAILFTYFCEAQIHHLQGVGIRTITTAQKNSLSIPSNERTIVFDSDLGRYEYWDGDSWEELLSLDQNNIIKSYSFGSADTDFVNTLLTRVNNEEITIDEDEIVTIRIFQILNGLALNRMFLVKKGKGIYNNSNPLSYSDLILISTTAPNSAMQITEGVTYDLGDIGGSTIESHINGLSGTSYNLDFNDIYFFTTVESGDSKSYLYIGNVPITIGDGGTSVTSGDFSLIAINGEDITSDIITKTSELINDGSDGTSTYVETDELGDVAFSNSYNDLDDLPDAPTGLEAINEGNGIGWRFIGKNPANYGNIGFNAVDFSYSASTSSTIGSTGSFTATFGNSNINSGGNSLVSGSGNTSSGLNSLIGGSLNNSNGNNSLVVGSNLYNHVYGEITLGSWGTNYTPLGNASSANALDRAFSLAIGTSNLNRKEGLIILKSGLPTFPSLTTTMIDGEGTGKVAVTREWVEAQGFGTGGADTNIATNDLDIPTTTDRVLTVLSGSSFNIEAGNNSANFQEDFTNINGDEIEIYSNTGEGVRIATGEPVTIDATTNGMKIIMPSSPTVGQVLKAASTAGDLEWGTISGGGATQLSDLTDVNTSTPTNRNVLVADGTDWESRALTVNDISDYNTITGLVALNEGSGVGYVLSGRNPANFLQLGTHAIEMSYGGAADASGASGAYSTILGGYTNKATGLLSTVVGGDTNIAQGSRSIVLGGALNDINNINSQHSAILGGRDNDMTDSEAAVIIGGLDNTTNTGSDYSAIIGARLGTVSAVGGFTSGFHNTAHSYFETSIGLFGTNYAANSTTSFNGSDRLFNLGNGTDDGSRSDALTILKNGTITAPSFSIAEITTAGNSALITKEYADATYGGGGGSGDMLKSTYDPNSVEGDAFDMDNMVEGTDTKILTASERTAIATNTAHTSNTSNPHSVTKSQVGLGNVDNTSDANKPISTATQAALDTKISSDGTGRTNAEELSNQYAQSRADYATDGAPSAGTWVFIKDPLNGEELAAGSTTIDFVDANGYAKPYIFLDNTTDDETSFDLVDMRELDVVEIYLNQSTEPTFVQTVERSPGTLDWTTDNLANTDLTLTVWKNGLGDIEKVYTKRP